MARTTFTSADGPVRARVPLDWRTVDTPATCVGPAGAPVAPRTAAVTIVGTGVFGWQVKVTFTGPRVTSTLVEAIAKATSPPTDVNDMSGTANVVTAGNA